jgi:2-dehydro-3-deoxyphosphogluconate aldolase/(4S)-4-hydroxy-2-oxoglutarate aldolase
MHIVELTATTPDVHEAVGPLAADGLIVGVGTIVDPAMIGSLAAAGARFVVSFFRPHGFAAAAHAAGLQAIPGGFTPAELAAARGASADAVKLFPARLATPAYVSDLAPLLPGLRLVVTGGLVATTGSLGPWLAAGVAASALGPGSARPPPWAPTRSSDAAARRSRRQRPSHEGYSPPVSAAQ